jgi:hypothetical protein
VVISTHPSAIDVSLSDGENRRICTDEVQSRYATLCDVDCRRGSVFLGARLVLDGVFDG